MVDLRDLQAQVLLNKMNKGFNTTDLNKEFCYAYGELSEAYEAYRKGHSDLAHELADVVIYLLGISEILGIDLETAITEKIAINHQRTYKLVNGVYERIESK